MPSVQLQVSCDATTFGEQVAVVGSWNKWDKNELTILQTSANTFPSWETQLNLSPASIEYKYVIVCDRHILRWEPGPEGQNRILELADDKLAKTADVFGKIPAISSVQNSGAGGGGKTVVNKFERTDTIVAVEDADRHDVDRLERAIVRVTAEKRSWRQRLAYVRALFTDTDVAEEAGFERGFVDHLVTVAVYLNFLSTGQVRCDEDGGHHRPNHHAHEARRLELALSELTNSVIEKGIGGRAAYVPYVVRRIFPLLPSYSSQFTVSVPLTRIRDIAHRGDIPKDFKLEIKHKLQNKLHRCAGPEDLATSQRFLDRVNGGGYTHGFTEQYRIFHEELRAFFNASSTDERLRYLMGISNTKAVADMAGRLLSLKHAKKSALEQMDVLTELRQAIADLPLMKGTSKGEHDLPDEDTQKTRLADIDLEGYAFLLLAGVAKDAEQQQKSCHFGWQNALQGLCLSLRNVALSGISSEEANATANELVAVNGQVAKMELLRVKAAVDRASRFAENFSSAISDVYMRRVSSLGKALKVDHHAISVFAEAEIRSNVTFQASRIADACRQVCRKELSLPPWDPLYAGEASGKLLYVEELADIKGDGKEGVIAVCRHAEGDEDIPPNVHGVVLGRPLPHLSHLGVRARQAGVVFVCAEDRDVFEKVWQNRTFSHVSIFVNGREGLAPFVKVDAKASVVASETKLQANGTSGPPKVINIKFDGKISKPLLLEEVTTDTASSKSAFAGKLAVSSKQSDGLFHAADGVALPHGIFQNQRSKHGEKYGSLIAKFSVAFDANRGEHESVAESLHYFIKSHFVLDAKDCKLVQQCFKEDAKVMVRSSANAEDLEDMSGAGLYDSIANVAVHCTSELQDAVSSVWASLWTKRAATSRASYHVSHEQVSMAVLIQEMVVADLSFVGFSRDPVTKGGGDLYIEAAVGMGETLASATADGSPYRFRVNRDTFVVENVAFASYGEALVPDSTDSGLVKKVVDYSVEAMSANNKFRNEVVVRIAKSIVYLEQEFDGPQDVEGAITVDCCGAKVYVVQARPQIL